MSFTSYNKHKTLLPLLATILLAGHGGMGNAEEKETKETTGSQEAEIALEAISVYGEQGQTDTATKLNLLIFETPQTVTAVSREQMDDFALDTFNEVLDYTPGVTVEDVETNRFYYTARGFDIVNFQYDGIGVPFVYGINVGEQDTAIYEKVEVVKGAAGLITGLANPSATINFVRKRPTDASQADAKVTLNQWNGYRLDGDISGSISSDIRGRLVAAKEDTESYLDRHKDHMDLFYGVIEADLSEQTLFTIGHSYNKNASDGVLYGALPLLYADGSPTDYDVSTSTSPDWTFADSVENQTFVELKQELGERWDFNAIYTRTDRDFDSELFYVYGTPELDETGLNGWASAYTIDTEEDMFDISVSGSFNMAGREHELVVGYNHAKVRLMEASYSDPINGFPVLGSDWAEGNSPRPDFTDHDPSTQSSDIKQTLKSLYVASRFNLTDELSMLMGARQAEIKQRGFSYGAESDTEAKETVPYFGVTYEIVDTVMVYGSYSEVFTPQAFVNASFEPLGATSGKSREIGIKKSFNDERVVLTASLFQSELTNLGEWIGRDAGTGTNLYEPRDYESEGFEVEISGELIDGLNIGAGLTKVNIKDQDDGEKIRPYIPEYLVKASASYRIPQLPDLKVAGALKWQDDITTANGSAKQKSYALLDLALLYGLSENLGLAVNLNNVTDEKYYNSLNWDQAYFGAPRNIQASLRWEY